MQKICLIILTLFLSTLIIVNDASATQIQIVTDNGNVFPVQNTASNSTGNTNGSGGNGTGNGNGVGAQIVTVKPLGIVVAGTTNNVGTPFSLIPYNRVTSATFAAGFQNGDNVQKLSIPQINAQYTFSNDQLQQAYTVPQNILSIASTTVLAGSGSATSSSNGITFSGPESMMATLLDNGLSSTVIDGTGLGGGGSAFFGTLVDSTLVPTSYDGGTHGYTMWTSTPSQISSSSSIVQIPGNCYWIPWNGYYCDQTQYVETVPVNKYVSSQNNAYATFSWNYYVAPTWSCWGYGRGRHCGYSGGVSDSGTIQATINGYQSGNFYYIASLTLISTTDSYISSNPSFTLYDKSPFDPSTMTPIYTTDFESQVNFIPSKQYYLIVQPSASGTTMKASTYDPSTALYFKASGLPPGVPYQVLQNGIVGVSGVTDNGGTISLSAGQIAAGGQTSISGELDIYPNSPAYVGTIGTAVYDTVNNQVFNIPSGITQIYTPFAYIRIPISSTVNISNIVVNGISSTSLPYLTKSYVSGSSIMIPFVPGLKIITFNLNGIQVTLNLNTIQASTGFAIISPGTQTITQYKTDGSGASVEANTGGESVSIAPKDGTMYALVSATVSADVSFSASASYNYVQNPPTMIYSVYDYTRGLFVPSTCPTFNGCQIYLPSPTGATSGPLSLYVDTYVNGKLANSQIVYSNTLPQITQSSSISNYVFSQSSAVSMHYQPSTTTQLVQVNVHAGDLVEFNLRASVGANGNPITVPSSGSDMFTTSNQISIGTASVNLSSGSVLTGMS